VIVDPAAAHKGKNGEREVQSSTGHDLSGVGARQRDDEVREFKEGKGENGRRVEEDEEEADEEDEEEA
jgi:hypothetical protein